MEILKTKRQLPQFCNDYTEKLIQADQHFQNLFKCCGNTWHYKWGSYLFNGLEYQYYIGMYDKQKLLYDKIKNCENILEIGTYMGHSLLIMLLANPKLKITCIDIENVFAAPATRYLQENFPESKIKFIQGSSLDVLPAIKETFDFFHIDGNHKNHIIEKEFNYCKNMSSSNIFKIIFDDVDSCKPLISTIKKEYKINEEIVPNCEWSNAYYEIIL